MTTCFDLVFLFSPVCRCETTAQSTYLEIIVKRLSQGHNSVMFSTGIEPATLKPLTRHSNLLIYAANFLAAPSIIWGTIRHWC